jgi:hypothetical protein
LLKFSLPDSNLHLEVESEVAWSNMKGLAGFRFHNVPKNSQERLEQWLDARMEEEFPGAKQRLAAAEAESQN